MITTHAQPHIADDELVVISMLGNMAAFDELVRRYRGAATRVATQILSSRSLAEEVVQDAFLQAFKSLPQLQDPGNFAGWLCAITRHRARRVGLSESRTRAVERSDLDRLILEHCPEMSSNPAEEMMRRSDRALIPTAVCSLPDAQRIVIELRYYEEWPIARIADFLLLPVTTVKWRLHTGRTMMRKFLTRDQYPDSQNGSLTAPDTCKGGGIHHEFKRPRDKTSKAPAT